MLGNEYRQPLNRPAACGPLADSGKASGCIRSMGKAIQTPNSDTPYSFLGLDLRKEAIVLSFPAIQKGRYYLAQFIDLHTFNFAYVGSRAAGIEHDSGLGK
jgi:hypothetical protein